MRRAAISAIFLTALLLLSAQLALAAKPAEHIVEKFAETFPEDLCGVPVMTHVEVNANILIYEDGSFTDLTRVQVTWTDADGDWLRLFAAGRTRVQFEEDENGLLTITEWHSGVQERLRSAAGITAAFDRGRIVFVTVIDLNDPGDPEDDELVSFETVFVAGPHPDADSDFTLFCDVVTDVLG